MRLFHECPSLLSEFQFLIRHIQAAFLPPTVHLRDCDGHHNFLADDLWRPFKQHLISSRSMSTFLRPRVQFQRQLLSTRGDCRVKIHLSNPFFYRTEKEAENLRGATNWSKQKACRRIWREWYERLPPANRLLPCAPRSAVNPIESGWSKRLGSKKFSRQSETQPSNQFLWISEPGIAGPETWRKLANLMQPTYLPGPIPLKRTA